MKKVLIIGAGFVGQGVVEKLRKDPSFSITLINYTPEISYKPLYPDVAGGRLSPDVIEYPLARYAAKKKIDYVVGNVENIDFSENIVCINGTTLSYDYCVLAPGVVTNFYGREELRAVTHVFDSLDDCRTLNKKVEGLITSDKRIIRIVIIGGGYTGVEYVTHLVKLLNKKGTSYEITIVEIAPEILGPLSVDVKKRVNEYLTECNVRVKTNAQVETITKDAVCLSDERIQTDIVVWTAGMCGTQLCSQLDLPSKAGRIVIDATLRPQGMNNVFIAGDAASLYRMAVPYAKQYAAQVVKNLRALEEGKTIQPFQPKEYGYVIGLAGGEGLGEIMGMKMKGWYGFAFHYFMCFLTLLGKRNKIRFIASFFKS
ncbi:NAD(P)/FAD-dependent oxidoreductase [Candidatus Omnitrophota bacterium]